MSATTLKDTALALVAPGKGILAADESHATIGRRFEALGIPNSEEKRRRYRQMLFTTKGISELISGVILFDETIRQAADDGRPFVEVLASEGIIPGIKVDRGAKPLAGAPGEQVTEGLDGLRERLAETWAGDPARVGDAQRAFRHRARCNSAARSGAYTPELERSAA